MLSANKNKFFIGIAVVLVISLGTFFILRYLSKYPSTDDAYVTSHTTNIAAQITGPVNNIYVTDQQFVKRGQLLFTIDPAPFELAVQKTNAALAAQKAAVLLAEQNAKRLFDLVKIGQASKATGDQVTSQLNSAKATLLVNQAQLAQAKLDLAHTQVTAPNDGIISQFSLRPGDMVTANVILFMIVEQNNSWIAANFKETQMANLKPRQSAKVTLDMYPNHVFEGIVESISSASGSVYSLLPPENASGNWVKVTQRFPVKIVISNPDPAYPLRAGATASVTVDTTSIP